MVAGEANGERKVTQDAFRGKVNKFNLLAEATATTGPTIDAEHVMPMEQCPINPINNTKRMD